MPQNAYPFFPATPNRATAIAVGFRFGHVGTHSSRTIMLEDLTAALAVIPAPNSPGSFTHAIVEDNCLAKQTFANRKHSLQNLRELYALDPAVPIFRILAHLWTLDPNSRPLLALLTALARDPLLLATVPAILPLPEGAEFQRNAMRSAVCDLVGDRLSESTLEKVVRNTASSWSQAGHLTGRTFKHRCRVQPTPTSLAFALYLAEAAGFHGQESLSSSWVKVLDCNTSTAIELALEAKRLHLLDLRSAGAAFDLNLSRLDPFPQGAIR